MSSVFYLFIFYGLRGLLITYVICDHSSNFVCFLTYFSDYLELANQLIK